MKTLIPYSIPDSHPICFEDLNPIVKISKKSNSCLLGDIGPIFNTEFPFHVFWKESIPYSIQSFQFICFWKILIPHSRFPIHALKKILISYSRFPRIYNTDLQECSPNPFFPDVFRIFRFPNSWTFSKILCFEKWFGTYSWIIWNRLASPT